MLFVAVYMSVLYLQVRTHGARSFYHAAAGTAKAAADGWALAEALEKYDSVPEALEVFQRSQLALAKNLLDRTRRVGAKSQFLNTWDPRDPEVIFGLHKPGE